MRLNLLSSHDVQTANYQTSISSSVPSISLLYTSPDLHILQVSHYLFVIETSKIEVYGDVTKTLFLLMFLFLCGCRAGRTVLGR